MKHLLFIIILLSFFGKDSFSDDGFRRPFQKGDYYEFEFQNYNDFAERYWGRVSKDTLIGGLFISTIDIYNEPAMGNYSITYKFDTLDLKLFGGTSFNCPDSNGNYLSGGFNFPVNYVWNTCNDTLGGIYFRSEIIDTGTFSGILQSGIPLKSFTRKDTIGSLVDGFRNYVFSEMFGFLYYYSSNGSPFGPGWYSKELKGAIIDGVTYGSITLGINQISNEVPSYHKLEQNYPNPFNPSTTIRFSVSNTEDVKLIVYDQLGNEIRSLVDEKMNPGSYEYRFINNNLSSGVYYYKLTAGSFHQTKRMVLVK